MTQDLLTRLQNGEVLLHYAPLHSMLTDWGKPLECHLSQWIIDNPDKYQDAIAKSLAAGCDFVSTSTQSSSPWRAQVFGLQDKVHELNYKSAALARQVVPQGRYLAGFVSMTNPVFIQPYGPVSEEEFREGYTRQIAALLEGGVDVIMVVGNHLEAGEIAIGVVKRLSPKTPVISQNVYYTGQTGFRTMMGYEPALATPRLIAAGADVVGASCGLMRPGEDKPTVGQTHYYEGATELIGLLRAAADGKPISIQPNAGPARLIDDVTVYPASPEELAANVANWIEAGASIVGGCCGTNLGHYQAIRPIVDAINARRGVMAAR